LDLLNDGEVLAVRGIHVEKEEHDDHGNGADRQVDVKAPAPRADVVRWFNGRVELQHNLHMVHKRAADDGPHHRTHTKGHAEDGCVDRPFAQRHKSDNDHHAALEDARRSNARDCPTDDKCH
jgi:hypothetical protein